MRVRFFLLPSDSYRRRCAGGRSRVGAVVSAVVRDRRTLETADRARLELRAVANAVAASELRCAESEVLDQRLTAEPVRAIAVLGVRVGTGAAARAVDGIFDVVAAVI